MKKHLYAIRDNVANAIMGGVHVHAHHAPAVRMFTDIAKMEGTSISMHMADYDLLCIGTLDDETGALDPAHLDVEIILTGAALQASMQAANSNPEAQSIG